MPVKSKAQLGKLGSLVKEGKMSKDKFNEFLKGVDVAKLPERVTPKEGAPKGYARAKKVKTV